MVMIIRGEQGNYNVDDTVLLNVHKKVYIKEIPSLETCNKAHQNNEIDGKIYNSMISHMIIEFANHDGNVVCVKAFPPFPSCERELDLIVSYIRTNYKDATTKIFFDNLYEGNVELPIIGIHTIIDMLGLPAANVYYCTGGLQAQELYDNYCSENGITDKINIRTVNVWERHVACYKPLSDSIYQANFEVKRKDRNFLCFNRIAREHRIALLSLLYQRNLVEKSFYSFHTSDYVDTKFETLVKLTENVFSPELYSIVQRQTELHKNELPLLLNSSSIKENVNYVKSSDKQYYDDSYFSIVTETFFFGGDSPRKRDCNSIFFSEKTFKPIACMHPFIVLNRPHSLEYLRNLGYETFHPFIDETYDTITDDETRLLAIVNEVERLCNQTEEDWLDWQEAVSGIVEHNYHTLYSKHQYAYEFKPIERFFQ